jgi:TolA-binding protein
MKSLQKKENNYLLWFGLGALFLMVVAGVFIAGWWKERSIDQKAGELFFKADGVDDFKRVIELYPKSQAAALAQLELAQAAVSEGETAKALDAYRVFIKNFPNHPAASYAKFAVGECLEASGKVDEARKIYEQIVSAKPADSVAIAAAIQLAKIYITDKKSDMARDVLNAQILQQPKSPFLSQAQALLDQVR